VALVAIALSGKLTHAAQVAVGFDSTRFWNTGTGQGVYGWQFTANSEIQVLTLGIYDNPGIYGGGFVGDGLVEPHVISIWEVADHSAPLLSAATPVGTTAPLSDGFRYVSVSPLVLHSGHQYVISASYPNVSVPVNPNKDWTAGDINNPGFVLTVGTGLTFGGYRSIAGYSDTPLFPDYYVPGQQYGFGPNFSYSVVPEPSSLALVGIAASVLLRTKNTGRFRRRSRGFR